MMKISGFESSTSDFLDSQKVSIENGFGDLVLCTIGNVNEVYIDIIEEIKKNNYNRVVFLGDIFDIRYSINTQVGMKVKNLVRYMSKTFNKVEFYFIAGNSRSVLVLRPGAE